MTLTLTISEEAESKAVGARLGTILKGGDIICLAGPLGAGKSTLCRAAIQAACTLKPPSDIPSPTFTLVESYDGDRAPIHHYDLYRLEKASDVYELRIEEAMENDICLIEWAERIAELLPPNCLIISINPVYDETGNPVVSARTINFIGDHSWETRIMDAGMNTANFKPPAK